MPVQGGSGRSWLPGLSEKLQVAATELQASGVCPPSVARTGAAEFTYVAASCRRVA